MIDRRFGKLIVIERLGSNKRGEKLWKCLCDCGNTTIATTGSLNSGRKRSCRCGERKKYGRKVIGTSTYNSYHAMKHRCLLPKDPGYKNYGARGITVCQRWLDSFANFLEDMGERPEGTTLDRINNNLGYFKENCRWATRKDQRRNSRQNHYLEYNGKTLCIEDWSRLTGIKHSTICRRIIRGWSVEKTLTKPVGRSAL